MKEYIMCYENEVLQLLPDKIKELVRCRNCVFFEQDNIPAIGCGHCELIERTFGGDDYCSYGQRRV